MSVDRTREGVTLHPEARPDAEPAILKCDGEKALAGIYVTSCTMLVLAHRAEAKGWASAFGTIGGVAGIFDLCPACRRLASV